MKFFWKEKGKSVLATGAAHVSYEMPTDDRLYFGGHSFRRGFRKDALWQDFPDSIFFAPEQIQEDVALPAASLPHVIKRNDVPTFPEWKKKVGKVLQSKELEKVVLARRTTLHFDTKVDPWALVHHLEGRGGTLFLFQVSADAAFVGITPEKLYRREGKKIFADALAGTRPRGKEKELRGAEKEQREFGLVKQFVEAQLAPFCRSGCWKGDDGIARTATLAHLYNQFRGLLKESVTDKELLTQLHPTPAMGGTPRQKALDFLHEEEPFERGWYSAPLGWMSPQKAHFAIGIRSALIRGKEVHLFAGAGIVKGSDPQKEWEELNSKVIL